MIKVSEKYLLDLFRLAVISHAGNKCEWPDCYITGEELSAHHFFSRIHNSIKYDPLNGVALCSGHHTGLTISAHQSPTIFRSIIINIRGQQWLDELTRRKNQVVKANDLFRVEWKERLLKAA